MIYCALRHWQPQTGSRFSVADSHGLSLTTVANSVPKGYGFENRGKSVLIAVDYL